MDLDRDLDLSVPTVDRLSVDPLKLLMDLLLVLKINGE